MEGRGNRSESASVWAYGEVESRMAKYSPRGAGPALLKNLVGHTGRECIFWPFNRNASGYGLTSLNGRQTLASRAMCMLAHGEPPTDRHEAAHSCGNGHLGCINPNCLRWATPEENEEDKALHNRVKKGSRHWKAAITEDDVRKIMSDPRGSKLLSKEFGISDSQIRLIRRGGSWNHVTGLPPAPRPPSKQTKAQREAA